MRYFLLVLTVFAVQILYGQNNAEIIGRVFDSNKKPLEKATVSIVSEKDSLVISYALTDEKGKFDFVKLPAEKALLLYISHVNSQPHQQAIKLKSGEKLKLDSIIMSENTLEEIVVRAVPPIRLNGDTLEYKADYFKTRPNATVEELLQLLPGLQVNADGKIYYQGREVSGVRVNNKDFFSQDMKIATKNLDASLIDIVQVIKDKGESNREIIDDSELPIVINLKMKKDFLKANFGKFYGGAATRDRYESGALLNSFRDTLQVSFIGFANNIGRQGFDYSELSEYGGYGRAENNSYSYYGYGGGLTNQISTGVNANYDIGKILKTNLMYNFEKFDYNSLNESTNRTYYNEVSDEGKSFNKSENNRYSHSVRAFTRYRPDTTFMVSLNINVKTNDNRNHYQNESNSVRNNNAPIIDSKGGNNARNKNGSYSHNFYVEKKFQNKWLLSLSDNYSINDRKNNRVNASITRYYLLNDSLVDQAMQFRTNEDNYNLYNKLNLQIPVTKKINWDIYSQHILNQDKRVEDIQNKLNSPEFVNRNDVANNLILTTNSLLFGNQWNIQSIKNLPISFGLNWLVRDNRFDYFDQLENRSDKNAYWLPNANISYKGLNFNYSRNVNQPNMYNLVAVNNNLYPTSTTFASPFFPNTVQNTFSGRYNKYFNKQKINFYLGFNLTNSSNSVMNDRSYDIQTGLNTNQSVLAKPTQSINGNMNFSKTFVANKTWRVMFNMNGYAGRSETHYLVNKEVNLGRSMYGNWSNTLTLSYKDNITFTPSFSLNLNNTMFDKESENFRNTNNLQRNVGGSLLLNNIYKFRIESSYNLRNQVVGINNQRQNLHLINASVYYPVFKKGELKLSAFDILNQNVSSYYYAYENMQGFSNNNTLKQYFMLGMVYKFLTTDK